MGTLKPINLSAKALRDRISRHMCVMDIFEESKLLADTNLVSDLSLVTITEVCCASHEMDKMQSDLRALRGDGLFVASSVEMVGDPGPAIVESGAPCAALGGEATGEQPTQKPSVRYLPAARKKPS